MHFSIISLEDFFAEKVKNVPCEKETKAYLISTFTNFKQTTGDFSKDSVTLKYIQAQSEYNFELYQQIADWILFIKATFPKAQNASDDYYNTIAQLSYYKCYKMLNGEWKLFEELADRFPVVVKHLNLHDGF